MKTINLYFDFEFTSLSPDAQPISLGIISDELCSKCIDKNLQPNEDCENCSGEWHKGFTQKSFYAEFSDYDSNRCDDWVKENVLSKLLIKENSEVGKQLPKTKVVIGAIHSVSNYLKEWLHQFSDYQIQFICDCGTWDWYWLVQLLAEWEIKKEIDNLKYLTDPIDELKFQQMKFLTKAGERIMIAESENGFGLERISIITRTGLPKLPDNISPVPFDLNDLISIKKSITPKEAFDLNREELCIDVTDTELWQSLERIDKHSLPQRHNALWDAKVIKEIYQKLKRQKGYSANIDDTTPFGTQSHDHNKHRVYVDGLSYEQAKLLQTTIINL
ncbi:hypothetical protein [Draconibacterium mangrovi]|uniref:hypothetical protein n=1 Tax=Draconibacterium mangrovi TaxID=2697469 RepID=UPI0013D4AFA2|nr:hypothetical protein [Draconibacterium mangrovi]